MIVHTIHTLKIKDYILFDETSNVKHLIRCNLLRFFAGKGLNKLKEQLVNKFNPSHSEIEDTYLERKLFFYYKMMYFKTMYLVLKERHVSEIIDAFKIEFATDFSVEKLHLIKDRYEFFENKYKDVVEERNDKQENKEEWTLMDEISQIESILGVHIDRNEPIFTLFAYRKRVSDKLKALDNGK